MVAERLNTVKEYYFATKLREIAAMNQAGKDVINLGIGSPDMAPHSSVIAALAHEAVNPNQHAYQSYTGSEVLRTAIAKFYAHWYNATVNPTTEVLPLIGSKEGIMHLCMAYLNAGDGVLIPNPGYPTYSSAATLAGGTIQPYNLTEENNWLPNFTEIEAQYNLQQTKLIFVNYPHMPTGALATTDLYQQIIAFAKKHNILVVNDNPYSFILNSNPTSILSVPGAMDCCVELNSLSKSHNMAGWRIGMLVGASQHISNVLRFKSNMDSGMFLPLQLAAATALQLNNEWFTTLNAEYALRQQKAFELLQLLNCNFNTNQAGMFVWAKIPTTWQDGYALSDEVLKHANVFITPGGIFGSNGAAYVRVSLCISQQKFVTAINRIKATNLW
jgi:LL-diaminopimelate aminotransferase